MKHLLGIDDLERSEIEEILRVSESFVEVGERLIPKVPALRGKTVVSLFYEDSTRTRLSFETAAKRLSADVMNFSVGSSSVKKGESIRDTVQTISAMGVDAFVVRHRSPGVPHQITQWTEASVINGGDGARAHPTQALIDCLTMRQALGKSDLEGVRVAIVGDIAHSRVARSNVQAFAKLGAEVTLVAPPTLLPPSLEDWPVNVSHDLDSVLLKVDVIYLLRVQNERISEALFPSVREYVSRYGLTNERGAQLDDKVLVMHPGPMNRGVEVSAAIADGARSLITKQVANGVPVRMAVLYLVLQGAFDA